MFDLGQARVVKEIFCFDFPKGNLNALGKIKFFPA